MNSAIYQNPIEMQDSLSSSSKENDEPMRKKEMSKLSSSSNGVNHNLSVVTKEENVLMESSQEKAALVTPTSIASDKSLSDSPRSEEGLDLTHDLTHDSFESTSITTKEGSFERTESSDEGNTTCSPPTQQLLRPRSKSASSPRKQSPPLGPSPFDLNAKPQQLKLSKPSAIRHRVQSTDRVGFNPTLPSDYETDGTESPDNLDDEHHSYSDGSDGEGSYFSEHLPSPKSGAARRRQSASKNSRDYYGYGSNNYSQNLLPPTRQSNMGPPPQQYMNLAKSHMNQLSIPHLARNITADSDLSLSDTSSEEDISVPPGGGAGTVRKSGHVTNTSNNPPPPSNRSPQEIRRSPPSDRGRPPTPTGSRPELPEDLLLLPRRPSRVQSGSSIVSSSSEECSKHHRRHSSSNSSIDLDISIDVKTNEDDLDRSMHDKMSYARSFSSKQYRMDGVESELSDGESISGLPHSANTVMENERSSRRGRALVDVSNQVKEDIDRQRRRKGLSKVSSRSTGSSGQRMTADQMQDWRDGFKSDSHISLSPDRKSEKNSESTLLGTSLHSKSSTNKSSSSHRSNPLAYSEDDTEDSMRIRHMLSKQADGGPPNVISTNPGITADNVVLRYNTKNIPTKETSREERSSSSPLKDPSIEIPSNATNDELMSSLHSDGQSFPHHPPSTKDMDHPSHKPFLYCVYWKRWLMLFYISILNLLSDWTCYSVAPIAVLTSEAFGYVNPQVLVTVFLLANAFSTALEPMILSRLGLRKTIVFGAGLLMLGSVIKSGGIPGVIGTTLNKGDGEWRIYAGFILVGLSQPLYQCTPTLLSCSWFPEKERTLATGIALNSNQLGIGFAFVCGTLMVATSDDIVKYFGLLSIISVFAFLGCLLHFDDAPPSPPSETARAVRGTLEMSFDKLRIPSLRDMRQIIPTTFRSAPIPAPYPDHRGYNKYQHSVESSESRYSASSHTKMKETRPKEESRKSRHSDRKKGSSSQSKSRSKSRSMDRSGQKERSSRRRASGSSNSKNRSSKSLKTRSATSENGFRVRSSRQKSSVSGMSPSPSGGLDSTAEVKAHIQAMEEEAAQYGTIAPSPMMSRGSRHYGYGNTDEGYYDTPQRIPRNNDRHDQWNQAPPMSSHGEYRHSNRDQFYENHRYPGLMDSDYTPDTPFANLRYSQTAGQGGTHRHPYPSHLHMPYHYNDAPHHGYHPSDPRYYQMPYTDEPDYYHHYQHGNIGGHYSGHYPPQYVQRRLSISSRLPEPVDKVDDGAEPVLVQDGDHLDIEIRDDQIFRSIRACLSRPGFIHAVIAFAASGIVINTLSTYMDYLVRLGGSGRKIVGVVGGSFQVVIMISSMTFGKLTDKTRAYYSIIICLLLFGAFALAECGVNLDAERGVDLKLSLMVTAVMIGPLQPIATELGVDV